jgi:DNA-directed RNA polymerase specialized sigma24 family protein
VVSHDEALALAEREVRRLLAGRPGLTADDVDDLTQESLVRLLSNRGRLEAAAWPAYAVSTAGNLLRDQERAKGVQRRNVHRLHTPDLAAPVEDAVVTAEEHAALRRALEDLPSDEAAMLVEHHVSRDRSRRSVGAATAARLSRARAKLRVAYVLAASRASLPTSRCRPVLEALSTGERRRQARLGAGRHLSACRACAALAPALVQRRRSLAGLAPSTWGTGGATAARGLLRRRPGRRSAATTGAVLASGVTTAPGTGAG